MNLLEYLDSIKFNENKILADSFDYKKYINDYIKTIKLDNYPCSRKLINDKVSFILSILFSNKFSVYNNQMSKSTYNTIKKHVEESVFFNKPIQVVLAGMPGKCANKAKVKSRLPDFGEFSVLIRFLEIDKLIKEVHSAGIKYCFFSDYIGLTYSFFPLDEDIFLYVNTLNNSTEKYNLNTEIKMVTDILPSIQDFKEEYVRKVIPRLINSKNSSDAELFNSIKENINMTNARKFYNEKFSKDIKDDTIIHIAVDYYLNFWKYWREKNAVHNYYGSVIYGSPVAYHPSNRLCIRLQDKASMISPWNGVGVIRNNKIISAYEMTLKNNAEYLPIHLNNGQLVSYYKKKEK